MKILKTWTKIHLILYHILLIRQKKGNIPLSNGGKKKQNHYNLEKTEIAAIIFFAFILILFFIKILTPIIFGTCLYKYSYLKYSKGNNYISVEDNLTWRRT